MNRISLGLCAFFFLLAGVNSVSAETIKITLNKKVVYQSEVLKIQLIRKSTEPFFMNFLGRKQDSFLMGKYQTVLIGIDYQLKPGTYSLTGVFQAGPKFYLPIHYKIRVKEKFPKLKYQPPERPETEQARINQESKKTRQVSQKPSRKLVSLNPFVWPVKPIKVNAKFGERRCRDRIGKRKFNCRYHLGTDYRAAFDRYRSQPVKIFAINKGKVILTDDHLMDGKIAVIDHGNGISSGYLHLSKLLVKEGDWVKAGQKIGIAGKTGATEAVHLHLFIKMDNGKTLIDPDNFLQTMVK